MATIVTKFNIGETCWTFDARAGVFTRCIISSICIVPVDGYIDTAPEIYYKLSSNQQVSESDCLTAIEAKEAGNLWLTERSVSMFTSVGL